MTTVQEYINQVGDLKIVDADNKWAFVCSKKDKFIAGVTRKIGKNIRVL